MGRFFRGCPHTPAAVLSSDKNSLPGLLAKREREREIAASISHSIVFLLGAGSGRASELLESSSVRSRTRRSACYSKHPPKKEERLQLTGLQTEQRRLAGRNVHSLSHSQVERTRERDTRRRGRGKAARSLARPHVMPGKHWADTFRNMPAKKQTVMVVGRGFVLG